MAYTEAGFTPYTIVRLTCSAPSLDTLFTGAFSSLPPPHGTCARTLRFRPAQSIPRSPSQSGRFFAIHLLQTLKKSCTECLLLSFRDLAGTLPLSA